MATLTYGELQTVWLNAAKGTKYDTPQWAHLMAAIALAESSGITDNNNYHDPNGRGGTQTSWGLWQISDGTHNMPVPNIDDPMVNAKQAIEKLNTQGLQAWGTYTHPPGHPAYLKFMSGAPPANLPPNGSGSSSGGGDTATLTGFNPVSILEAPITGAERLGKWAYGFSGLGQISSDVQGLAGIATTLGGLATGVNRAAMLWSLLFRPELWLRVGAAAIGVVTLILAFYFMSKAL